MQLLIASQQDDATHLHRFALDTAAGRLAEAGPPLDVAGALYFTLDPAGQRLYCSYNAQAGRGEVAAYRLDTTTGQAEHLGTLATEGGEPCYLALAGDNGPLLVSNYAGPEKRGSVVAIRLDDDGRPAAVTSRHEHAGHSANPRRQGESHPHSICPAPAGHFVYVPDLGIDRIIIYRLDAHGRLRPADVADPATPPGAGPRHLTFHPTRPWVYVVMELTGQLLAYHRDEATGSLEPIDQSPTLPDDFAGSNTAAELLIAPDGRHLFSSNRGHDSIAVHRVDDATGRLTPLGHCPTGGGNPRHFELSDDARFLIVSNTADDNVTILRHNEGHLEQVHQLPLPRAGCLKRWPHH